MIVVNAPTLDRRDGGRARVQRVQALPGRFRPRYFVTRTGVT
eukprot:COSAG01_NODE_1555_length_9928_cov_20.399837_3_plen_42_part_00